jgi:hypothetical protein
MGHNLRMADISRARWWVVAKLADPTKTPDRCGVRRPQAEKILRRQIFP